MCIKSDVVQVGACEPMHDNLVVTFLSISGFSSGLLSRGCFSPCNPSNPEVTITNTCGCRMPMQSRVQCTGLFIAHALESLWLVN